MNEPALPTVRITRALPAEPRRRSKQQALVDHVHALHADDKSKTDIASDTGPDRQTNTTYLAVGVPTYYSRWARTSRYGRPVR